MFSLKLGPKVKHYCSCKHLKLFCSTFYSWGFLHGAKLVTETTPIWTKLSTRLNILSPTIKPKKRKNLEAAQFLLDPSLRMIHLLVPWLLLFIYIKIFLHWVQLNLWSKVGNVVEPLEVLCIPKFKTTTGSTRFNGCKIFEPEPDHSVLCIVKLKISTSLFENLGGRTEPSPTL